MMAGSPERQTPVLKEKAIPLSRLMDFHAPGEVEGFCRSCPRYGKNWGCPPHSAGCDLTRPEGLAVRFRTAVVRTHQTDMTGFEDREDAIAWYHSCRRKVNDDLRLYAAAHPGTEVLISGHCSVCESCTRETGRPCLFPGKQKYSPESLGFRISDLLTEILDTELQWEGNEMPAVLNIVTVILRPGPE